VSDVAGPVVVENQNSAVTVESRPGQRCQPVSVQTSFAPIRVAVTGSRVSPGLYESLELLGRETSLERLRRGAELTA